MFLILQAGQFCSSRQGLQAAGEGQGCCQGEERYSFPSLVLILRVDFFCAHILLALIELKSLLLRKDNDVTDLTNIMYRHTDAVEKLTKLKADADKQMDSDMKQIRELAADRDQKAWQLADLEAVAQVVVDMVEDEEAAGKSLLEQLREAPQRLSRFFSDTSRDYLAHALGLVKSFLLSVNLSFIGDGVAIGCSEERFSKYVAEMKPIANKVISSLEPALEA